MYSVRSPLQVERDTAVAIEQSWAAQMLYTCRLRLHHRRRGKVLAGVCIGLVVLLLIVFRANLSWNSSGVRVLRSYEAVDANRGVVYGIVFDAGSTGSRIHIFRFLRHANPKPGRERLELLTDDFFHVEPGLSSYANDPKQAAASLEPLMKKARTLIPTRKWADTLTVLQATAGLRLLPETKSTAILNEVKSYLKASGLRLPKGHNEAVSIMEGATEGVMSWVTLNFILHRLAYPSSTFGALDLGGGSTQITFLPAKPETLSSAPKNFIVPIPVAGKKFEFYTTSYLGLGLMSARHQMMGGVEGKNAAKSTATDLGSPCLPPEYKGSWSHGGKKYSISSTGMNGFQACIDSAAVVVKELYSVDSQREFRIRPFYAFSYFYDRARDVGLIKKGSYGKVLSVKDFLTAAEHECSTNTAERPFLCMDLCYISSLLVDGYRFTENTKLHVMKKVRNVELSWCLGTMVNLLYGMEKRDARAAPKPADLERSRTL